MSLPHLSYHGTKARPAPRWLSPQACNGVYWSPLGRHVVLAGLKGLNGQLEFFSVDEFDTLATAEHFMWCVACSGTS